MSAAMSNRVKRLENRVKELEDKVQEIEDLATAPVRTRQRQTRKSKDNGQTTD